MKNIVEYHDKVNYWLDVVRSPRFSDDQIDNFLNTEILNSVRKIAFVEGSDKILDAQPGYVSMRQKDIREKLQYLIKVLTRKNPTEWLLGLPDQIHNGPGYVYRYTILPYYIYKLTTTISETSDITALTAIGFTSFTAGSTMFRSLAATTVTLTVDNALEVGTYDFSISQPFIYLPDEFMMELAVDLVVDGIRSKAEPINQAKHSFVMMNPSMKPRVEFPARFYYSKDINGMRTYFGDTGTLQDVVIEYLKYPNKVKLGSDLVLSGLYQGASKQAIAIGIVTQGLTTIHNHGEMFTLTGTTYSGTVKVDFTNPDNLDLLFDEITFNTAVSLLKSTNNLDRVASLMGISKNSNN